MFSLLARIVIDTFIGWTDIKLNLHYNTSYTDNPSVQSNTVLRQSFQKSIIGLSAAIPAASVYCVFY